MKNITVAFLVIGLMATHALAGFRQLEAAGGTKLAVPGGAALDEFGRSYDYDVETMMTIPYPTTVGIPVFGEIQLVNLGTLATGSFMAEWSFDGSPYPLYPAGPYSLNVGQTRLLSISDPNDPEYEDFWMPDDTDLGVVNLTASHSLALDQNTENDSYLVRVDVLPVGKFEMGVDSRSYTGAVSIPASSDGPVVHLNPDEINPDFYFGLNYDITAIRYHAYFSAEAGGAPHNASMRFHIYRGGDVPGDEIYTGDYDFDVAQGYVGWYEVVMNVTGEPGLQWVNGDVWLWAESTDQGDNGYDQPGACQTRPNALQYNQYASMEDAESGAPLTDYGHHLTIVTSHLSFDPPVTMNLTPLETDIPHNGGSLFYQLEIISQVGYELEDLCYWVDVTGPEGYELSHYRTGFFSAWPHRYLFVHSIQNAVPGWAPEGVYTFTGYVGYPPNYYATDSFTFTKGGAGNGPTVSNWEHEDLVFTDGDESAPRPPKVKLPSKYSLGKPYPNPFNPTTSLELNLPEATNLSVAVYNMAGQRVATVAEGWYPAGMQKLTIDGTVLSSGVYFVQVSVPGHLNEVQKIVLMK